MNKMTAHKRAIEVFRDAGGLLSMAEALRAGVHRRQLYQLRDDGALEVIERGLYRLVEIDESAFPDLVTVAKKVPSGVICLISALAYHEITTQIPHYVYVALPQKAHTPTLGYPPLRCFWYSDKLLTTGVEEVRLGGCQINIFDREKTLVDCVKFRNKIGMDIVLESLKMYWNSSQVNLDKLFGYAAQFRVKRILQPIMETITSG